MKNNKYLYVYIIFCLSFCWTLNLSNSISIAYDSNPLKYSASEEIFSSRYLAYSTSLSTKHKFFKRNMRLVFSLKNKYYDEVSQKSNYSLNFKAKQSLGNYQYLTFSYNYINDIYLRPYKDEDQVHYILDYLHTGTDCFFDYSIITLDYESPIIRNRHSKNKIKFNFSYIYETQFYDKYFTEFDLELKGTRIKYSTSTRKNKHYISIAAISAENLTADDNTLSTLNMDRGYNESRVKIYFDQKLKNNESIGFLITYNTRKFTSAYIEDKLHNTREHVDKQFSIQYNFMGRRLKNKITFKSRDRDTKSPYQWVKDLKTFKLYSIEYTVYFNKIGFK